MHNKTEILTLITSIGVIFFVIIVILLAILIPVIIAQWKLFKKAGKNGWEAIVPFYNTWVMIEIAGLNRWYFLITIGLSIISSFIKEDMSYIFSITSYYINFIIYYNIAKKTKQKEVLYGILGIFVPYIAVLILGFSNKITYDKTIQVSPNGLF